MIVYVFDKRSNHKLMCNKLVTAIHSTATHFILFSGEDKMEIAKTGIKIVVYGH